jgi:iron complex transport system substrate-binding protein
MKKYLVLLAISASLLANNLASAQGVATSSPRRIISLSPTATEDLFAIGAGNQVIAVDDQSNYPTDAPMSDLSGYMPNVEAILAKRPDLVVVSNDMNDVVAGVRAAHVRVLIEPAAENLTEVYQQITELGSVTGHVLRAKALTTSMKKSIATALASLSNRKSGLSIYHELDNTYYSVTSDTFLGSLYKLAGLQNIADAAPDASYGYPQLSAEYIIQANPDYIFLGDTKCCSVSPSSLKSRPGFRSLNAVKRNHIVVIDDDIASRWGPRTVDLFKKIVRAIPAK